MRLIGWRTGSSQDAHQHENMVHENSVEHFLNGNVQSDLENRGPDPADGLETRASNGRQDTQENNHIDSPKPPCESSIFRPDEESTQIDKAETMKSSGLGMVVGWANWKKLGMVDSDVESRDGIMIEGDSDEEFVVAEGSLKTVNQVASCMSTHHQGKCMRSSWLNIFWLLIATLFLPAGVATVWFGVLPIGNVGDALKEESLWLFVVNPGVYLTLSYTIIHTFLSSFDDKPWQLLRHYTPVLVVNYMLQVGVIGAAVHSNKGAFPFLGLVALLISVFVTVAGIRMTPTKHLGRNNAKFVKIFHQLVRLMAALVAYYCILIGYILASRRCTGTGQGFLTVALSILTSIWKNMSVRMVDFFHVEIVVLIAGLWLENLADVFISLALVTATHPRLTFTVIFATRVLEDIGYMLSEANKWRSLCNWVKRKFNIDQGKGDAKTNIDRRKRHSSNRCSWGHGRNVRFLAWKLLSQLSSTIVFLSVVPMLRFGHNQRFYPFGENPAASVDGMIDANAPKPFSKNKFEMSVVFSGVELAVFSTLAFSVVGWVWMYHKQALNEAMNEFSFWIVSGVDFGLMVAILVSNVLLGVSAFQVPSRLYFL
ncbi:hypothetical protein BSKO_08279 [Bryopsis sp. KO-2023]|nr:hypothetical protein BSKO_08279 [Bryopsis sp. KO-2023]